MDTPESKVSMVAAAVVRYIPRSAPRTHSGTTLGLMSVRGKNMSTELREKATAVVKMEKGATFNTCAQLLENKLVPKI